MLLFLLLLSPCLASLDSPTFGCWVWGLDTIENQTTMNEFLDSLDDLRIAGRVYQSANHLAEGESFYEKYYSFMDRSWNKGLAVELLFVESGSDAVVIPESMVDQAQLGIDFENWLKENKRPVLPVAVHWDLEPAPYDAIYNLTKGAGMVRQRIDEKQSSLKVHIDSFNEWTVKLSLPCFWTDPPDQVIPINQCFYLGGVHSVSIENYHNQAYDYENGSYCDVKYNSTDGAINASLPTLELAKALDWKEGIVLGTNCDGKPPVKDTNPRCHTYYDLSWDELVKQQSLLDDWYHTNRPDLLPYLDQKVPYVFENWDSCYELLHRTEID